MSTKRSIPSGIQPIRIHEIVMERYVYMWTIKEWNSYLNRKIRDPLEQIIYTANGKYEWKLLLVSNMCSPRKRDKSVIRLAVVLIECPQTERSAEAKFQLLDEHYKDITSMSPCQTISKHEKNDAIVMELDVDQDTRNEILKNDVVNVQLELKVVKPATTAKATCPGEPLGVKEFLNLPKTVFDKSTWDTAILVDGMVIPAHQSVLAEGSPVFKSVLRNSFCAKLDLSDMDYVTAEEIVTWLYTKKEPNFCRLSTENIFDFMEATRKYALGNLNKQATDYLACTLNASNAIDVLIHADTLELHSLKEKTLQFMVNNRKLFGSQTFQKLQKRGDLLQEIISRLCA